MWCTVIVGVGFAYISCCIRSIPWRSHMQHCKYCSVFASKSPLGFGGSPYCEAWLLGLGIYSCENSIVGLHFVFEVKGGSCLFNLSSEFFFSDPHLPHDHVGNGRRDQTYWLSCRTSARMEQGLLIITPSVQIQPMLVVSRGWHLEA
jgi:hypothetical protein